MDITASTNIKAFSKNQSYKRLRQNHFDLEDREEKGISKNKKFEKLNQHFGSELVEKSVEVLYEQLEKSIEEYNERPSQVKTKSRRHKNLADYVEKRKSRKNINKDFHGLEYMMVSKLGSMESWQQVVDEFKKHNVNEEDTLNCLNRAFLDYYFDFNKSFRPHGLMMIEADTNLDEMGAPHMHSRIFLDRRLKTGLPDTNLANALKDKYGEELNNRELMEKFRFDLDNSLVEHSNVALKKLAKERGFEFEDLNLVRLEAEEVGLTHNAYKQKQERKRQQEELDKQQEALKIREQKLDERENQIQSQEKDIKARETQIQSQEQKLTQRSKALDVRESSISSREALLDKRDTEISLRDKDSLKKHERESEALKEIEDTLKNAKSLFDFGSIYETKLKKRFFDFDRDLVDYISEPFYEKMPKTYNRIQKLGTEYRENVNMEAITKERNQHTKKIHKTEEDYMRLANQMVSQIQDNEHDDEYEL